MYFWNAYPFVRLSIALILGIVSFDRVALARSYPMSVLCISATLLVALIIISERLSYFKLRHVNGSLALFIISFLGGYLTKIHYHSHDETHYKNLETKHQGFSGVVLNQANERSEYFRYDLALKQIISNDSIIKASGKIHLYVRKDSVTTPFLTGDKLNVVGRFFPISPPANPGEFDYKIFLARQNIYAHAFVRSDKISAHGKAQVSTLKKLTSGLQVFAVHTINEHLSQPRENGIAKALLLGIKDHLDNEIKAAYSSAGAMHVLAVSGLHVGIIFMFIKLLFGKLKERGNFGRCLFGLCSVAIIWMYALVTGLSPSVLRAATMFSIVAISDVTFREGNIYNSLGLAAFILLLFDPYLVYSVGFQLSFSAVIGIVYFQPKLYRKIHFRWLILDKIWAITCVSIAAQIATFPLTLFYFHQFPSYFLLSNLIVIPAAFVILLGGLAMIVIDPLFSFISAFVGQILQKFIWLTNELIGFIHRLPNGLIEWIYMDWFGLIIIYGTIITLAAGLHYQVFKTLTLSGLLILGFFIQNWIGYHNQSVKNELVFYHVRNHLAIDHIQGLEARLFMDEKSEDLVRKLSYHIDPGRLQLHLPAIEKTCLTFREAGFLKKHVIRQGIIGNQKIILIDSTTFHLDFKEKISTDIIIINNEAVKNLNWLQGNFTFQKLILSTKNSTYYAKKMKKQAEESGLKIHSISEDGVLRLVLPQAQKKSGQLPALFTTNPD